MSVSENLSRILTGKRDSVDTAVCDSMSRVSKAADHVAVKLGELAPGNQAASTVFWAYYRTIYHSTANLGGLCFVSPNIAYLNRLRHMIAALLGLRDVNVTHMRAGALCPAMRNSKEAQPFNECAMISGLPFGDLMSWDISNIVGCCDMSESFIFTTVHPSRWRVRASNKGDVLRIEDYLKEVVDLTNPASILAATK